MADYNEVNHSLVRAVLTPLILLDLRMPNLDGSGAAERIRNAPGPNDTTPIIAFSAEITSQLAPGLFDGLVAKPLSAGALVEAIARAIQSPHLVEYTDHTQRGEAAPA
jgi:CheY-like chemotaxis protein